MVIPNTCLLIIDVQKALFQIDGLYSSDCVIENIGQLISLFMNHKLPIIYIQHTEEDGLFSRGKTSWEIHDSVSRKETKFETYIDTINKTNTALSTSVIKIIEKTSWDGFLDTKLHETLQSLQVSNLIVAGMQTEFCLDTTLRRAYSMGYKSTVASDAHTTFDSNILKAKEIIQHHNNIWNKRFAKVICTKDIISTYTDKT